MIFAAVINAGSGWWKGHFCGRLYHLNFRCKKQQKTAAVGPSAAFQ
jgi:hypothetical protein